MTGWDTRIHPVEQSPVSVLASTPMTGSPTPKRTDAALRVRRFRAQERLAERLRELGWVVDPPPPHVRGLANLYAPREKK